MNNDRGSGSESKQEHSGILSGIKNTFSRSENSKIIRNLRDTEYIQNDVETIAGNATSDTVTPLRVSRIIKHLDYAEQPLYMLKGGDYFGLRIEGGDTEIRKGVKGKGLLGTFNNLGGNMLVSTTKRVFVVSFQTTGDDIHSIPYDSITGIDSARGAPIKVTIQTHGRTYHMEVTDVDNLPGAVRSIREQREEARRDNQPSIKKTEVPLEQIEKLGELLENGVITPKEFEEKKESLLEKV